METMSGAGVGAARRRTAAFLALLLATGLTSRSQTAKPTEYQVKAAYLVNFLKFIEWPASAASVADDPYPVCVLGQDPFGSALDAALAGESVKGHPLVPRRVSKTRDAAGCRVVFLGADSGDIKKTVTALDKSALTVSDLPQFLKRGGMIQFVLEGNRVRFEVNLAAAKAAGLSLSSELLKVAAAVR
jgi:hypothetical protein